MKICVIGTGYVGLVAGTCFAETGNDVICMDVDEKKIAWLQKGKVPIYEPGLQELIRRNVGEKRLCFTTDLPWAVENSLIVFIAVGTPAGEDGSSDLSHVMNVAQAVAKAMDGYKIIVTKSTVPVGTAEKIRREISSLTRFQFDVVSNPEFLKEGAAIEDFMKPDRVVIGAEEVRVVEIMKELYAPFMRTGAPILVMDMRSAEMTKYAANAMLASRISFMNEIANLCEHVGADVNMVRQALGRDRRIGASFLFPGLGYGGSCFPKDIKALINVASEKDYPLKLIKAVEEVNDLQKHVLINKILRFYSSELPDQLEKMEFLEGTMEVRPEVPVAESESRSSKDYSYVLSLDSEKVPSMVFESSNQELHSLSAPKIKEKYGGHSPVKGKRFTIWGLSFKPQTDDMREAPSQTIIEQLLRLGAKIQVYDPEAMKEARKIFGNKIRYAKNNYEALKDADALILVTEWNEFRNPDFNKMKKLLKYNVIFDGRNQYSRQEMRELGFLYFSVGRP
ncbi:UDP-glucose/GDP-mannose dehydrogenase family protein [Acidobacteria bacterium AH-259-D05]|nr:UDP-glucose/GDP-mannose dehydrogenase family protein [Acidobacteria bacterium AH-259-D05]